MAKINPWKVTGYKAGQNVACKVNYAEKDGYAVTIQKDNLPGFIKTANTLKAGDEILGVFVCVHNGRILLSQLFSAPRATAHQLAQNTVNWQEHLDDVDTLDQAYEMQAQTQRNQRLGITGDNAEYQQPQSPTDFSQYQGNATTEQAPINLSPPQQDFSQYAPPQQYNEQQQPDQQYQDQQYQNQQYQNQQQYESGQQPQYENPQPNPYQSTSQYDAGQGGAWADPTAQSQYAQPAEEPMSQFQKDLMEQQEAARQAAAAAQQHTGQHQAPQAPYQPNPYGQPPSQSAYGAAAAQQAPQQMAQHGYAQQPQQMPPQAPPAMAQNYQQAPQQMPPQQMPPQQQAYQQPPQQEQQWQSPQSHVPTKKFRLRRAIDLVMPPVDQESLESLKSFKIADYDMEWLITDLEGGMRTGCIKATSEQKLSRSAALLYRGRAVGCIYGCKANPDGKPTEESLSSMLSDLEAPDAVVTLYDLPEDVTLAMSALFLGYPLDRDPNMNARQYCDFLMNWLAQNSGTACLAVTIPATKSTYLVFVHKGKFAGAFFVEEQQFTRDASALAKMFDQYPDARIEASSINSDTLNSGMRFGYSLSMARQKRSGF
ncbi:MAG: hypothetical protein JST01_02410 [Cyanobacteria bacterium SZAS TMP-1]|nr:hypothetical protein [Cyanobacteria bacterium SZAS TMP-1]